MIFYTPVQIVASVVYANDNSTAHTDPTVKGCTNRICSQKQRFQLLRSHCEKNPQLKDSYDEEDSHTYYRLLVDDKHKLLYCALPKAASTTFYNMFYYSYTGKFLEDIHCRQCWEDQGILSHFSKSERDKRLRDYYKIMVVRHPLDRLISCWNGKFTRQYRHPTWLQNGPRMIEMFRELQGNTTLKEEIKKGASFNEFVRYANYLEATEGEDHNRHWRPHHRLCHPCSIEYDLIVKVETMQEDSKAVLYKLGLNQSEFPLINARRTGESETLNLEKTLMEYADIGDEDMRRIHEIYDHDMQLSGYEWDGDEYRARCGAPCNQNGCC
ncbi:hypothetical protein CAPTEDRAFT_101291 [Capitella teleta]|uniref:Carbohydrate sulfotransferase n=1 Tax=Capitella teleta TaxID=283909 RepID=R7T9G2_CAPTE|nr:hypothetical protein CAPTEDRAFT_101291 [Capitella teleta]|eukprot:ELT90319.1 hypothetical protein CAPTEDRAFT_101291 [Capitella teleta]